MDLRLALDQNFPEPILNALRNYIRGVELKPVGDIDPRLPRAYDWQLLLALSKKGYDGLVTQDAKMLNLAKELLVIEQTKLKGDRGDRTSAGNCNWNPSRPPRSSSR